jgi:hypothetical protein
LTGVKYFSRTTPSRALNTANVGWERNPSVLRCLEAFGRRELYGQNPWHTEGSTWLRTLHRAVLAANHAEATARMTVQLEKIMERSPWAAFGVWRFLFAVGPRSWLDEPRLRDGFLRALRTILAEAGESHLRYRPNLLEEKLIREREPDGGPLWSLLG